MKIVTLTKDEMEFCERTGHKRYAQAVKRDVERYGREGHEQRETGVGAHIHGLYAENVVVKYLGGESDRLTWNSYVDGRVIDLKKLPEIVIGGICIDAKSIVEDHFGLLCGQDTVKSAWAYVLVNIKRVPICSIIGFMWGERILQVPKTKADPDRPPAYLIKQSDPRLRPFEELIAFINTKLDTPIVELQSESDYRIPDPPDLEALAREFGGFSKITPTAWREYDQALEDWKASLGMGSGSEIGARFLLGVER